MWITIIALTIVIGMVFLYLTYKNKQPKEKMQNDPDDDDDFEQDFEQDIDVDIDDYPELFTSDQQEALEKESEKYDDKILLAGMLMAAKNVDENKLTELKNDLMNELNKNENGALIFDHLLNKYYDYVIDETKFNELKAKYPEYSNLEYARDVKLYM